MYKIDNEQYREAVWQYLIDHSNIEPNGNIKILFWIKSRQDFEKRLESRVDGTFARHDPEIRAEEMDTVKENFARYKANYDFAQTKNKLARDLVNKIEKKGNIIDKLYLKIYKLTEKYLFGTVNE